MTESWFADGVRALFAAIDSAVYSLISVVYEIILQLSKVEIFGPDEINVFATKVYSLLGIFMLFKVSFSFISYLVNPDEITDKSKGAHKIVLNILIVLAMIIITPTAFKKLYEVQNIILDDNIIPKFLLGTEGDMVTNHSYKMSPYCEKESYAENDGNYISILVFRPFYQPEVPDNVEELDKTALVDYCAVGQLGGFWGTPSRYLQARIYNNAPEFWNGTYTIDYKFFISTIVGIIVLLVLVSFCFDIAVRTIKLGFLQLIAPVPIISYVDPKSGKDGMFKKWLKEVGKTWADLFIRLFALFFALYIIKLVVTKETLYTIEDAEVKYKFWVDLLLIIGSLMFAKKLPKLLENILGIKIDSGFTLNPMKKIRDNALGGKIIGDIPKKTLGLGAGLVGGAIAGGVAGQQVGATKRGALLGALGGAKEGFKKPKGAFTAGMREEYKNLTGNEMSRFSLGKLMLSKDGKVAVDDTKSNLKIAYENLNNKQTELNISEHTTASLAESLRSKGVDLSNIDDALKDVTAKQISQFKKVEEMKSNAEKLSKEYAAAMEEYKKMENSIKSGIVGANGQPIYSQEQLSSAKIKMEQIQSRNSTYQREIEEAERIQADYAQAIKDINTYSSNKKDEAKLRDEISAIQKNIETIKSEKAQRERFYQVEKSPQKDYQKAVDDEIKRQNK